MTIMNLPLPVRSILNYLGEVSRLMREIMISSGASPVHSQESDCGTVLWCHDVPPQGVKYVVAGTSLVLAGWLVELTTLRYAGTVSCKDGKCNEGR